VKLIDEQLAYYRARAGEYDSDVHVADLIRTVKRRLRPQRRVEHALEMACGTGLWTPMVLSMAARVTLLDGSPEMLRIARARVGAKRVRCVKANIFKWKPDQEYDLVFFANWLSHVPPRQLLEFLRTVRSAVRPGGRVVMAEHDSRMAKYADINPKQVRRTRRLHNGKKFAIVKVFYDLTFLRELLTALGFRVSIHKVGPVYFVLSAVRKSPRAPGNSAVGKLGSARRRKK